MLAEFDENPTTFDEPRHPGWREHVRRMIELRWPNPQPERTAGSARTSARSWRSSEWDGSSRRPVRNQRGPSKATLQRRLKESEREVERIREQLAAIDENEGGDRRGAGALGVTGSPRSMSPSQS